MNTNLFNYFIIELLSK